MADLLGLQEWVREEKHVLSLEALEAHLPHPRLNPHLIVRLPPPPEEAPQPSK